MMSQTITFTRQSLSLSLVAGILCALFSITAASDNAQPKPSALGRVNIQLNTGSINNLIQQSQGSSSITRIGAISKSQLNSVDIKVKVGEVNNVIVNSTNSSARTNIGTITDVSGNRAKIDVDVRKVNTKVLGGRNNHALTNIGVLKDVNITGAMAINVRAKDVSNIIAGGSNNTAEVSLGYDPSAETDETENGASTANFNNPSADSISYRNPLISTPVNPDTSLGQVLAVTNIVNSGNNAKSANKYDRTAFPKVPDKYNYYNLGNRGTLPMVYKTEKRSCLDVNDRRTCLQVGGISMKLFVAEKWADTRVVTSPVSPWENRSKFNPKIKIKDWKKTPQVIVVEGAKNRGKEYWKYCCAKSEKTYRVSRKFKRVYTAISKEYEEYAKRMNEYEKNQVRFKKYEFKKTDRGKGKTRYKEVY